MQGGLLEEMSKFTKIGVATLKYQIQNNFQNKKFDFFFNLKSPPKFCFSPQIENHWNKLTKESSLIQLAFLKLQYRKH